MSRASTLGRPSRRRRSPPATPSSGSCGALYPSSTSARRRAISFASAVSAEIPTSDAAWLTSRSTASSTALHPRRARARRRTARRPAPTSCSRRASSAAFSPIASRTSWPGREELERRGQVATSSSSGGIASATSRELGEPADVAHDERLAERETADHAAGGLAHRRMPQVDEDVAPGHQRPQPALVHPVLADDPVPGEAEALEAAVEVEAGRSRSDQEQRDVGMLAPHVGVARRSSGIRLLAFTTPKQATTVPAATRSGSTRPGGPGRVRDDVDRPCVAGRARLVADVARVARSARSRGRGRRSRAGSRRRATPRARESACP